MYTKYIAGSPVHIILHMVGWNYYKTTSALQDEAEAGENDLQIEAEL